MENSLESLRAAILAKYSSLHAFCKAHKGCVGRSSVYQVFNGSYPGDLKKQLLKIGRLLNSGQQSKEFEQIQAVIKSVACARCRKKSKGRCRRCRATIREQAKQVEALLKGGDYVAGG